MGQINSIIKFLFVPVNKEGIPFISIFAATTFVLLLFTKVLGIIGIVLTIWCYYFFRDPKRYITNIEDLIVSPADGVVESVKKVHLPKEIIDDTNKDKKFNRVSIFLSVFDVHVNRVPIEGEIKKLNYIHGKFVSATLDKSSQDNERQICLLQTKGGTEIAFVQIAGLIARRIVCELYKGQKVKTGERFGIIRFGSRVDVYVPEEIDILVSAGQRAVGGETIIADIQNRITSGNKKS